MVLPALRPPVGGRAVIPDLPANPSKELRAAWWRLVRAQEASWRCSDARAALPTGSSRAKVTSANARWARAAEDRDRAYAEFNRLMQRGGVD